MAEPGNRFACRTLGWSDFEEEKSGTRQVLPNSYRTTIPIFQFTVIDAGPPKMFTINIKWAKFFVFFDLFTLKAKNEGKL